MKKNIKKNKKTYSLKHMLWERVRAFTTVEILLVVAIVAIIGLTSVPFLSRFFTQNATSDTYYNMLAELRKAQTYAMTGKQNSPWGVYYGTIGGTKKIILYQGASYASHTNTASDEAYTVNPNVSISGISDINFAQVTGTSSATTTITIIGTSNTIRTIQINTQGIVNYALAGPTNTPGAPTATPTATPTPTTTPTPTYTPPSGPPVFDASATITKGCNINCSLSQTIGNHSNRILVVGVGSATNPTSVTYGGASLTEIDYVCGGDCSSLWYLVNPPVGTNTVSISGGIVGAGSMSLYNVNQQTPIGGHEDSSQTGTSVTMNVAGTNTNQLVVDDEYHLASGSVTPGSGQTEAWLSGSSFTNVTGSYKSASSPLTNMSWLGTSGNWYEVAAAIN